MAAWLPRGAQVYVSMGSDRAWSDEAMNAAYVYDAVRLGTWQQLGAPGDQPEQLPRPSQLVKLQAAQQSARERMLARAMKFREKRRRG